MMNPTYKDVLITLGLVLTVVGNLGGGLNSMYGVLLVFLGLLHDKWYPSKENEP
jgi:hypothetical protein